MKQLLLGGVLSATQQTVSSCCFHRFPSEGGKKEFSLPFPPNQQKESKNIRARGTMLCTGQSVLPPAL